MAKTTVKDTQAPARRAVRKPRQTSSKHLGAAKEIPALQKAIKKYCEAHEEKLAWAREEKTCLDALEQALKAAGLEKKGYKANHHEAWLDRKVRVKARITQDVADQTVN